MQNARKSKIIVILGPTSSGKSDVAISLAQKFDGEVISADSRQIYRGLDIGTGKIEKDRSKVKSQKSKVQLKTQKLRPYYSEGIAHYLIDIVNPRTDYNVAKFKKDAERIIIDILRRGKVPIICGGTGFWIRSVVDNITYPEVKPDWELRNKLRNKTADELFSELKKLDPVRAENIDRKNKVRLIRAVEICKTLGKVPDTKYQTHNSKYDFLQIGISLPKEKLHENIRIRLKKRFEAGMVEEVEKMHKIDKLSWKKIESFGLGYLWIPKFLRGKIKTKEELFEKVFQAEKDYAKRQMTWFKKDARIRWLEKETKIEKEAGIFLFQK